MNRRRFVLTSLAGAVAVPVAAEAQSSKAYRIGLLGLGTPAAAGRHVAPLVEGLRSAGYIEGRNLIIDYRFARGQVDALPALATELVRLNVDVIVTSGAPAALAAKAATTTIPIVMAQVTDPVALGLVNSLARPGGNITGLANLHSDLGPKQLEVLRETVPRIQGVGCLCNTSNPAADLIVRHVRHAAHTMGLAVEAFEIYDPVRDLEPTFAKMAGLAVHAVIVAPDPVFFPHAATVINLAARYRLPAVYGWSEFVEAGGLMSYGPNVPEMFRRAAYFLDRIINGAKPGDLPVEQPSKFELIINMKTAKALGLTIPPSLLLRADHVIE